MTAMPADHTLRMLPPDEITSMVARMQSTASRNDVYSTRPGYGLTPERIFRVFRAAEMGQTREQCDLFEDVQENDGHLQGLVNNRIESLSGKEWLIGAGDTKDDVSQMSAAVLQRAMRKANTFQMIEHQLQAFWIGWSASEPVWQFVDGWWVPTWFVNLPAQRFSFGHDDDFLRITTDTNVYPGELVLPHWLVNSTRHRRRARGGAGRCATWWSLFKRMSVRDWIVFAEKFGIPIPMGIYSERAGDASRKVVEQAVQDLGEAGAVVMSELCKIVFAEVPLRSGDTSALHPSVVALCNAELSKLITGATLGVETGGPGSFALGKVHQSRGIALEVADAMRLKHSFRMSIGRDFNRFNGLAHLDEPTLDIQVMPESDPLSRARTLSILANELGMVLDDDQLRQDFKVKAPSSPDRAVNGTKSTPDDGEENEDAAPAE